MSDIASTLPRGVEPPLLEIERLRVVYRDRGRDVVAVNDVSLNIERNSVLALIGESGSGKTSLARSVCGLQPYQGEIHFNGEPLNRTAMRTGRMRPIQMVHQNPFAALNPRWPIWRSVAEPMIAIARQRHERIDVRDRARAALERVGIAARLDGQPPHRISGGQCQRVAIARAIATESKLLVLDEAVSALDAAVKKDILALLRELAAEESVSYLFVTHDMATVAEVATHVAVMESGVLVEAGTAIEVLVTPKEPYTQRLISAVPTLSRT